MPTNLPDVTTKRCRLRACAATTKWCVVCQRDTDKLSVQAMVLDDDGRETAEVICPDCLKALPTHQDWQRLHNIVESVEPPEGAE
jgi:hypothetical protein